MAQRSSEFLVFEDTKDERKGDVIHIIRKEAIDSVSVNYARNDPDRITSLLVRTRDGGEFFAVAPDIKKVLRACGCGALLRRGGRDIVLGGKRKSE